MTEQLPAKKKRLRSPSFPSISLKNALSKVQVLWDQENRHPVPVEIVATHWGYSSKSSGGKLILAALTKYGLVSQQGSNKDRTAKLTELAIAAILGEPDETEEAIQKAALLPSLHKELWDEYGDVLPSDHALERKLVKDKEFNPKSVQLAIRIYKETIAFSKLIDDTEYETKDVQPEDEWGNKDNIDPVASKFKRQQKKDLKPMTTTIPAGVLPIPLDVGPALIPTGMTEDDFEILLQTLQLWKRKIVQRPPNDSSVTVVSENE